MKWYRRAAAQGDEKAMLALARLEKNETVEERDSTFMPDGKAGRNEFPASGPFGARPLFVFHIFQMDLRCLDGNMDFPDGYSQGSDEQQESQSEDIC